MIGGDTRREKGWEGDIRRRSFHGASQAGLCATIVYFDRSVLVRGTLVENLRWIYNLSDGIR